MVFTVANEDVVRLWDATNGQLLGEVDDHNRGFVHQADWHALVDRRDALARNFFDRGQLLISIWCQLLYNGHRGRMVGMACQGCKYICLLLVQSWHLDDLFDVGRHRARLVKQRKVHLRQAFERRSIAHDTTPA